MPLEQSNSIIDFNLIESYIALIQEIIISSPNSRSPISVLRELLHRYYHGSYSDSSAIGLFLRCRRTHATFAQNLFDSLKKVMSV